MQDVKLRSLQKVLHHLACEKGWFERDGIQKDPDVPLKLEGEEVTRFVAELMLVTRELSEAAEEIRAGQFTTYLSPGDLKPEGLPIELADALMRLLSLSEAYGIDLMDAVAAKYAYAKTRPYRHGGKLL